MPNYIAILHGSTFCHTWQSSTIMIVRIVHLADRHTAHSSAKLALGLNVFTARESTTAVVCRWLFANLISSTARPPQRTFIAYPSTIPKPPFSLFLDHHLFSLIAVMPSNEARSASNASLSKIANSRVPTHQPALIPSIYTATSFLTNVLSPFRRIAGSDIPVCRGEAAAIEPRDTIGDPDVRDASLPPDLHVTFSRFSYTNITLDQLEHQTAVWKQCSSKQLYRLDTDKVHLHYNLCIKIALWPVNRASFNFHMLSCDSFGLANYLNARFDDILAR